MSVTEQTQTSPYWGCTSVIVRRQTLMDEKDVFCECPRCCGPDYASGVPCGIADCKGFKLLTCRSRDGPGPAWACQTCQDTQAPEEALRKLAQLTERFGALKRQYTVSMMPHHLKQLLMLYEEAVAATSNTHSVVIQMQVRDIRLGWDGAPRATALGR